MGSKQTREEIVKKQAALERLEANLPAWRAQLAQAQAKAAEAKEKANEAAKAAVLSLSPEADKVEQKARETARKAWLDAQFAEEGLTEKITMGEQMLVELKREIGRLGDQSRKDDNAHIRAALKPRLEELEPAVREFIKLHALDSLAAEDGWDAKNTGAYTTRNWINRIWLNSPNGEAQVLQRELQDLRDRLCAESAEC